MISAPGPPPGRTYHFAGEAVTVTSRGAAGNAPPIAITPPHPPTGLNSSGGPPAPHSTLTTGTASDSDGFVEIVEVYVNGEYIGDATYDPATETTFAKALTFDEFGATTSFKRGRLMTLWSMRTARPCCGARDEQFAPASFP